MATKPLGNINACEMATFRFRSKETRDVSTPLGAARASIEINAEPGDVITMVGSLGINLYKILPTGGGDRTTDGRWAELYWRER